MDLIPLILSTYLFYYRDIFLDNRRPFLNNIIIDLILSSYPFEYQHLFKCIPILIYKFWLNLSLWAMDKSIKVEMKVSLFYIK